MNNTANGWILFYLTLFLISTAYSDPMHISKHNVGNQGGISQPQPPPTTTPAVAAALPTPAVSVSPELALPTTPISDTGDYPFTLKKRGFGTGLAGGALGYMAVKGFTNNFGRNNYPPPMPPPMMPPPMMPPPMAPQMGGYPQVMPPPMAPQMGGYPPVMPSMMGAGIMNPMMNQGMMNPMSQQVCIPQYVLQQLMAAANMNQMGGMGMGVNNVMVGGMPG